MDIGKLSIARSGYYPAPRPTAPSVTRGSAVGEMVAPAARRMHEPVEYVVQGELLEKRRHVMEGDDFALLETLRQFDRAWRQETSSPDIAQQHDARRAIAAYTGEAGIPGALTGSAAAYIDYYV